jgi:hypothetical protein
VKSDKIDLDFDSQLEGSPQRYPPEGNRRRGSEEERNRETFKISSKIVAMREPFISEFKGKFRFTARKFKFGIRSREEMTALD